MEEDIRIKSGGRRNGKGLENAVTFMNYIDELETNKLYGIKKCGNITLLTKQKCIPISFVQNKIKILEKLQKEFKDNEELRIKIVAYKELLEE